MCRFSLCQHGYSIAVVSMPQAVCTDTTLMPYKSKIKHTTAQAQNPGGLVTQHTHGQIHTPSLCLSNRPVILHLSDLLEQVSQVFSCSIKGLSIHPCEKEVHFNILLIRVRVLINIRYYIKIYIVLYLYIYIYTTVYAKYIYIYIYIWTQAHFVLF